MFVSVSIPTHNRRRLVVRAVEALLQQDYPADCYEIIVCCDRCSDGTEQALETASKGRIIVLKAAAPGQTGALNTAIRSARGELGIFIDDEVQARPGFISAHVAAHEREPGAKIAVTGYSPVKLGFRRTPLEKALAKSYERYHEELARREQIRPRPKNRPTDLNGANFSIALVALRELGGFNQIVRHDFELAARLMGSGFELRYCAEAAGDMELGVTSDLLVSRAADWARADCRLAKEFPWTVPYLPFFAAFRSRSAEVRWRLRWHGSGVAAPLLTLARRLSPDNWFFVRYEYACRYSLALREEIGDWEQFVAFGQFGRRN